MHLDEVEGLGRDTGGSIEGAVTEAHGVMAALGIQEGQLVSHAYLDMLRVAGSPSAR